MFISPEPEKNAEVEDRSVVVILRNMNSHKQPIAYAVRVFPPGCGNPSNLPPEKPLKNPRTSTDLVVKKNPSIDHAVAAPKPKGPCFKQKPEFSDHVSAPNTSGTTTTSRNSDRDRDLVLAHDPTPRERVLDALGHFKQVFVQLNRDKQARRGGDSFDATARIDLKTLDVLEKMGMRVNTKKRIGSVPGIQVGDEFQYKTELRLVGLHSKPMCGIDYMDIGNLKLATSIVASDGYGYDDKFVSDVVVYTGEGGNVICKEKKTEDQKLVKGNLALANSMRRKNEVRVIRGQERLDRKGKRYVYDGLYLVNEYWLETIRGKTVYKFKLCRIPGQPPR